VPDRPMTTPSTEGHFTQVWNALITDRRLGPAARVVAMYVGSKTPEWVIRERDVCTSLGLGRDAYRTAMRELVRAGYATRGEVTRDPETKRFRSEPPTLNCGLVVADPRKRPGRTEDGFPGPGSQASGTRTPDTGQPTEHRTPHTDTQQEESSSGTPLRADALRGEPVGETADTSEASEARGAERANVCPHCLLPLGAAPLKFHLLGCTRKPRDAA
jgi:hypothetical protein